VETPKTAKEALQQCELVWQELASTGSGAKSSVARDVLGYRPLFDCPACEYASSIEQDKLQCKHCPIDAWRGDEKFRCETYRLSPYSKWLTTLKTRNVEKRKTLAAAVLELVRSSEAYND
jgi:hypothetical protein